MGRIRHTMGNDWGGRTAQLPLGAPRVSGQQVREAAAAAGVEIKREGSGWSMWKVRLPGDVWRTLFQTNYESFVWLSREAEFVRSASTISLSWADAGVVEGHSVPSHLRTSVRCFNLAGGGRIRGGVREVKNDSLNIVGWWWFFDPGFGDDVKCESYCTSPEEAQAIVLDLATQFLERVSQRSVVYPPKGLKTLDGRTLV